MLCSKWKVFTTEQRNPVNTLLTEVINSGSILQLGLMLLEPEKAEGIHTVMFEKQWFGGKKASHTHLPQKNSRREDEESWWWLISRSFLIIHVNEAHGWDKVPNTHLLGTKLLPPPGDLALSLGNVECPSVDTASVDIELIFGDSSVPNSFLQRARAIRLPLPKQNVDS